MRYIYCQIDEEFTWELFWEHFQAWCRENNIDSTQDVFRFSLAQWKQIQQLPGFTDQNCTYAKHPLIQISREEYLELLDSE